MSSSIEVAAETKREAVAAEAIRALEREVEKLHRELALTTRHAGMAEVATGVLHNVGNVLNSINVSATLVHNRLRQSRVSNMGKALALIREHKADLAGYLTEDPKGKMLPSYLETLADHLAAEQAETLREMENLNRNIEHVKEIVAMQQNYAKVCGVLETLHISELLQDAVRMNLGAFERHGVTIVRDFAAVPPVTVDRHKVLQILINLMRNAKYALDELGPPEKVLTLRLGLTAEGRVLITVSDNGIGIAPENLTRIFDRGFTTKRDGHGFGLCSGAVAAKEMGGKLTAHSDGAGKGATFQLELPVANSPTNPLAQPHGNGNPNGLLSARS